MYTLDIKGVNSTHEYEELIKVFLLPTEFEIKAEGAEETFTFRGDKNDLKRDLYVALSRRTGKYPKWGILTGIRPVKLTGELLCNHHTEEKVRDVLKTYYLAAPEKIDLLFDIYYYQQNKMGKPKDGAAGVYIGTPFCPTRCLYCSFTSNQVSAGEIDRYLEALYQEIHFVAAEMEKNNWYAETIYIGGGTPTTLNADQLENLLAKVAEHFNLIKTAEITVEAGRPDTIDLEKLKIIKEYGASRISINPQSMQDKTLNLIGRDHDIQSIQRAFKLAQQADISIVNADIIAGLPGETLQDFQDTLTKVIALSPENITVHTLAVKRTSKLKGYDADIHYKQEFRTEEMVNYARLTLEGLGYQPYYLYKQKQTAGNTENIGYCKGNTFGIYNTRIMEERQNIIALGAGGITKAYYPAENRLERVPNVSNYEIYIERIDEMLLRKKDHLFRR